MSNETKVQIKQDSTRTLSKYNRVEYPQGREVVAYTVEVSEGDWVAVKATFELPTELTPLDIYQRTEVDVCAYGYPVGIKLDIQSAELERVMTLLEPLLLAIAPLKSPI